MNCSVLVWTSWSSGVQSVYPEINRSRWRHRAEWELLSHRETFHKKLPVQTLWHRTKKRLCCLMLETVPLSFFGGLPKHIHTQTHTSRFFLAPTTPLSCFFHYWKKRTSFLHFASTHFSFLQNKKKQLKMRQHPCLSVCHYVQT